MLRRNSSRRNFGGRGGLGFKNNNTNGRQKENSKKTLQDFAFYVGSLKKASDYKNTELFVINHIKKDFDRGNNISEALQNLEYENTDNWNTILKASTSLDDDVKGKEDIQFELQFKADYGETQKRKIYYQENQYKAYELIWERCATATKTNIEARKDFEDGIYNDPVELLKAIKQHVLNYQESGYKLLVISDGFTTFFGTMQKDQESLQD